MENGQPPKKQSPSGSEELERVPVPDYIRTDKTRPRIFAALIVIAWAVLYVTGTSALERHYQSSALITDYALEMGEHHWIALRRPDDENCAGYVTSKVELDPRPEITVSGTVFLPIFNEDIPVSFSLKGIFSQVFLLERATGTLNAGSVRVSLKSLGKQAETAAVVFSSNDAKNRIEIPLPHPIYLAETAASRYSLRLPAEAREQINLLQTRFSSAKGKSHAALVPAADMEQMKACVEHVSVSRPSTAAYDLGSYLEFFGIKQDFPGLKELGATKE